MNIKMAKAQYRRGIAFMPPLYETLHQEVARKERFSQEIQQTSRLKG